MNLTPSDKADLHGECGKARQMAAYKSMGCKPMWICAPYQESVRPVIGQQAVWGESSVAIFIDSVLGARTARYPDLLDKCGAITGRASAAGLYVAENRRGQLLYSLKNIPVNLQEDYSFYGVLGHLIGSDAGMQVPVMEGLKCV